MSDDTESKTTTIELDHDEAAVIIRSDGGIESIFPRVGEDPNQIVPDSTVMATIMLLLMDDKPELDRLYDKYFKVQA